MGTSVSSSVVLPVAFAISTASGGFDPADWILVTGFWQDSQRWVDSAFWTDSI